MMTKPSFFASASCIEVNYQAGDEGFGMAGEDEYPIITAPSTFALPFFTKSRSSFKIHSLPALLLHL
jgi:hypothetical protein